MICVPGLPTPEQVAAKLPPGTFGWRGDMLDFDCPHCGAERGAYATSHAVKCGFDCSTHEGLLNAIGIDPATVPQLAEWPDGPLPEWWNSTEFDSLLCRTREAPDITIRDGINYRICPVCGGNRLLFNEILPPQCSRGCKQEQIFSAVGMTIEPPKSRRFVSASELLTRTITTTYLIHKNIEVNTTGAIFGPSGGGKTFQALHLACCVITGTPWNGQAAQRGLVLYLAGEGHGGIVRRVKAWAKHHDMTAEDMSLLHVSRRTIDLDGAGLPDVIAEAQELAEAHGVPVALIIIDTLARHLGGDENSTKDMGQFIKAVDSLRGALPGSVALIVHHTGHGEETRTRARGSSAFKAAMDFEIRCDAGLLTFTKMKDAEEPEPVEFKLVPVQIGTSDDGEPITSCVLHFGERSERQQDAAYTPMERQAIRALITVSARFRVQHDSVIGALEGDWREEFYRLRREEDPEAKQNTLKNAFRTVKTGKNGDGGLIGKGALRQIDNTVILTREGHQREIASLISADNLTQTASGRKTAECRKDDGGRQTADGISPYKGDAGMPPHLADVPLPSGEAWQTVELDL